MRFSNRDQIFGSFLNPVAEHGAHVERLGDHRGHYRINKTVTCLAKYAKPEPSSSRDHGSKWKFRFRPNEMNILSGDLGRASLFGRAFVGLICVPDSICLLKSDECQTLLRPMKKSAAVDVRVTRPRDCQMTVGVPGGPELDGKVPQSRFPELLFERGLPAYRHQ